MGMSVETLNYKRKAKLEFEDAVQSLMVASLTADSNSIEDIRKLALKVKQLRQEYWASLRLK